MKKIMMYVLLALSFMVMSVPAQAGLTSPYVGKAITVAVVGYFVASSKYTKACETEPNRLAAWKNNPNGYSFEVAGCDYQAKKHLLVLK